MFNLQWEGNRNENNQKGASSSLVISFCFRPHHWNAFFLKLFLTTFIYFFLNCHLLNKKVSAISTGRRSTSVHQFASSLWSFLKCKEAEPTPAGPRAQDYSSSTYKAGKRICCICASNPRSLGCPSQLANCS